MIRALPSAKQRGSFNVEALVFVLLVAIIAQSSVDDVPAPDVSGASEYVITNKRVAVGACAIGSVFVNESTSIYQAQLNVKKAARPGGVNQKGCAIYEMKAANGSRLISFLDYKLPASANKVSVGIKYGNLFIKPVLEK